MGTGAGAPINELVAILNVIDPRALGELRLKLPQIVEELEIGRIGGPVKGSDAYEWDRAEVAAKALTAVANRASAELVSIQSRMKASRSRRLIAQIFTIAGTSGVLGALALNKAIVAIAISVLALMASIGTVLADFGERLVSPGKGDIYEAFEQASNAGYRARRLSDELRLAISHKIDLGEVRTLILSANVLAEELNGWVTRMTGSR